MIVEVGLGLSAALLCALVAAHLVRYRREHRVWDSSGGLRSDPALVDVIDEMPTVVWTTDKRLRLTGSVGGGLHVRGLPTDGIREMTLPQFFQEVEAEPGLEEAHRRALTGETCGCGFGCDRHRFRGLVRPLRADGRVVGVVGMATEDLAAGAGPAVVVIDDPVSARGRKLS